MKNLNQNFIEKRIFPRYSVKDSSAVMLVPGEIISYCILNISRSGMSFCYKGKANSLKGLTEANLSFFIINDGSFDFSVQIISDSKLNKEEVLHVAGEAKEIKPYLRRCGVMFNKQSKYQEEIIINYIQTLERTKDLLSSFSVM